ncbi:MAG TPA: FimV/HubP family polar landmark protein [Usitatibacter sp.]|nr:FimV/HubP family polar landmark protein [Usitatibacter sp.]
MNKRAVALALLLGASLAVDAAGLGKLTVNSSLGQILNAEIDLVSIQPGETDTISARVAPPEAYQDARVEYAPSLRLLRFSVEKRQNGQPYLKVTSIGPINEPFLDALVEVSWPAGRLQREYPILLDPPGYDHAKVNAPTVAAAPAAAAPAPAPQSETPPAASPAAPPSTASAAPAAEGSPSARAEMPAGAQEAAPATGDTYGPIEKGETLSKIAGQVKPADVSLEQMLVALYRQNKDAFAGNNMNRLKTGQILRIPTEEEINQTPLTDARKEIHAQVTDWRAYRDQLAGGVASAPAQGSAPNAASGRVASAAVSAPAPAPATPSDTLKISKSDSGGAAGAGRGAAANAERLNALQEEITAKNKALQESQSRVADLEKQIQDMQRLLALKGSAPSKADTKVAAVPPPPVASQAAPAPAEPPKAEPTKPAEPPKPAEPTPSTTVASATPTPAPAPTSEAPKTETPPAAPKKAAPRKAAPPPPKSFMDELLDNPAYLAGGVGILALLGFAGFMVSRRRRYANDTGSNSQMTSAFPSDLKAGSTTGKPAAGLVDTGNSSFLTDFDKTGPGTIDTDEVDPVAEAEVYIAYGRDAQAEEILKEAMARDKGRHEIALKLLEIYHARKSATAFETVAKELRGAVGEGSPLWQKAAAMGAQIDPGNPLYGAAAGGTSTFTAMSPSAAHPKPNVDFDLEGGSKSSPAPAPSFDLDLGSQKPHAPDLPLDSAPNVDFNIAHTASPSHVDVPAEPVKEDKPAFDFDLSGLDLSSSKSAPEPTPMASSSGGGGLDLADLSLDSAPSDGGEAAGTKLELAKAYLEIGDKDGAREILHEVAKEGSSAQKEEAKKLIASL